MARITALEEDNAKMKAEIDVLKARVNVLQAGTSAGLSAIDTKLLSKPTDFEGNDGEGTRFLLKMKAYFGAIDPRNNELLKIAEGPDKSLNNGDLGPGDDWRDGQLFFVLMMLLLDRAKDKGRARSGGNSRRSTSRSGRADTRVGTKRYSTSSSSTTSWQDSISSRNNCGSTTQ